MAMRKNKIGFIIIFGSMLILMSCSNEPKKTDNQPAVVDESPAIPMVIQPEDSTRHDTLPQKTEEKNVPVGQPITDAYDEGYLDGEAMAEEDRLAGKPGMQVGMDDDDDEDYEDGFDDGYDE